MYDIIVMIGQFILGLSILVALHELGHMLPALWFGMRVEKFYVGFPPKVYSFVKKGIEYGIGAIPLGGFVKISGMVDESLDTENLDKTPQPYEFRSKPAWQRLIVMLGGVTVNFILGILVFTFILWYWGKSYMPVSQLNEKGIYAYPIAEKLGFKTGDKIVSVNGKVIKNVDEMVSADVLLEQNSYYTILRGNDTIQINIPNNFADKLIDAKGEFIVPAITMQVDTVLPQGGAHQAGILKGDIILKSDSIDTPFFQDFQKAVNGKNNTKVKLTVLRNSDTLSVITQVNNEGKIGIGPRINFKSEKQKYSAVEALTKGPSEAINFLVLNLKGFKKIFAGEISPMKAVGGPIKIVQSFPSTWVWEIFWQRVAMISLMLAFMNLLPIPALDGGHVIFLLYEIITRRKPSDKVVEVAQKVGMVLLLTLTVLVTFKDTFDVFQK